MCSPRARSPPADLRAALSAAAVALPPSTFPRDLQSRQDLAPPSYFRQPARSRKRGWGWGVGVELGWWWGGGGVGVAAWTTGGVFFQCYSVFSQQEGLSLCGLVSYMEPRQQAVDQSVEEEEEQEERSPCACVGVSMQRPNERERTDVLAARTQGARERSRTGVTGHWPTAWLGSARLGDHTSPGDINTQRASERARH